MRILITGAAGFIGYHAAKRFLNKGYEVLGFDSINSYYDPIYKHARLKELLPFSNFKFQQGHLENKDELSAFWESHKPDYILHLGAQAGIRYSIENPAVYITSNVVGFQNVIDLALKFNVKNFVFASTSSVYGNNKQIPFSESHETKSPISLYSATKLSNELVATVYGNLFKLPTTALRFFTVYGAFSRPDMAMFKFAKMIVENTWLPVYGEGKMQRDFTYVEDILDGVEAALQKIQVNKVYNLGRGKPENLMDMIKLIETGLHKNANLEFKPMQLGDMHNTFADISLARTELGYDPKITLEEGIPIFLNWYRNFHKV